jgi:hypothetical protein
MNVGAAEIRLTQSAPRGGSRQIRLSLGQGFLRTCVFDLEEHIAFLHGGAGVATNLDEVTGHAGQDIHRACRFQPTREIFEGRKFALYRLPDSR